jgi:hypothetical protein
MHWLRSLFHRRQIYSDLSDGGMGRKDADNVQQVTGWDDLCLSQVRDRSKERSNDEGFRSAD